MLRIHIESGHEGVTLRLEGKLIQPWVGELARVMADLENGHQGHRIVRIDLDAVSFVDTRGKSILAYLRRLGCELKGSGPFISGVIDEVASDPIW